MQGENLQALIRQNMNMVKAIAKRYAGEGIEIDDLIQEGVIGIMQAAENYKPNFNVSFTSYAGKWIKSRIKRAAAKDRAIQIPEHIQRAYTKITMTYRSLEQSTKHIPSANDIAYELGMDEEEVKNIICIMCNVQEVYSLNALIDGDESDDEIIDYVPAATKDTIEIITENSLKNDITTLLNRLKDRERAIIRMHMGFDAAPKTFEEIGTILGISRQRVCQLEKKAMRKLGSASNKAILVQYL